MAEVLFTGICLMLASSEGAKSSNKILLNTDLVSFTKRICVCKADLFVSFVIKTWMNFLLKLKFLL
jgi:hypothetical protein